MRAINERIVLPHSISIDDLDNMLFPPFSLNDAEPEIEEFDLYLLNRNERRWSQFI